VVNRSELIQDIPALNTRIANAPTRTRMGLVVLASLVYCGEVALSSRQEV